MSTAPVRPSAPKPNGDSMCGEVVRNDIGVSGKWRILAIERADRTRSAPNETGRSSEDINGLIDRPQINPSSPRTGWYRNPGDAANPICVSSENTDGRFVRAGREAISNNVSRICIMYIKQCTE